MSVATKIETMITMIYRSVETLETIAKLQFQWTRSTKTSQTPPTLSFCFVLNNVKKLQYWLQRATLTLNLIFPPMGYPRGPKSLNFPDGSFQRAKTFRTKCPNHFRKKMHKPRSRQKKCAQILLETKKVHRQFLQQKKFAQIIFATKKCALIVFATKKCA